MARAGQPTSPRTCWRDPRRHITAERRSEKLTRHRSHPMTAEYGIASFAARREARRLNVTRADGPKPPDAAKTRGVKEAISTSRTRWSYRRRLCCSWRRKTEAVERRASFEHARGLKTRTSKNAHSNVPPHKPRAFTSSRASGSRLALECKKTSPLRGCSLGSTSTSVQTSLKSEAVRSRISLCRAMVNPPLLHVRAWQLSNGSPHAQCEGRLVGSQPYRRAMASRNAPLCRANPCSWRGRAESQDEAPSSMARSTAESRGGDSWFRMARCACFSSSALSFFALVIARHWSVRASCRRSWLPSSPWCWFRISSTMGSVTCTDVLWWMALIPDGFRMPSPPRRAGRLNNARIVGLGGAWPVREGSTSRWSVSSRGVIQSSMLLTVRERYVHRLTSPCVSAQKARCGWTAAISASLDSSPFHFSTCSVTKASVYGASPSGVPRCRTPLVVMFRPLPLNMALASGRLSSFTRSQDFSRLMW